LFPDLFPNPAGVPTIADWLGAAADRWCVNPNRTVRRVSRGAIASSNVQVSGPLVSTMSMECRAVFARLGTLLAQRGFGGQALGRVYLVHLPFSCQASRSISCRLPGVRDQLGGDFAMSMGPPDCQ
jgi:hypothetical protein